MGKSHALIAHNVCSTQDFEEFGYNVLVHMTDIFQKNVGCKRHLREDDDDLWSWSFLQHHEVENHVCAIMALAEVETWGLLKTITLVSTLELNCVNFELDCKLVSGGRCAKWKIQSNIDMEMLCEK